MMRAAIILASATIVAASIYFKQDIKTVETLQIVEVPKIVEVAVPHFIEITKTETVVVEKKVPVLVKPKINWNNELLNGVKFFEGYRPNAYVCSGGVKTIGYGCTDKNIVALGAITEPRAAAILNDTLSATRSKVEQIVEVPLTPNQLNALTSFAYNCGIGNLKQLINGEDRLNSGNYDSVEEIMPQYRRAGGKIRKGLEKRRAWEVSLWKGEPQI
jgi:lysozyme